jgi:hypothetical protein
VAIFLLLLLTGCVTPPTAEQVANADYGDPPPTTYPKLIKEHMEGVLFDPYSARYRFIEEPQKGYAYVLGRTNPPVFGYLVFVGIDAKNLMGKYIGEKPFRFLFKDDLYWMPE